MVQKERSSQANAQAACCLEAWQLCWNSQHPELDIFRYFLDSLKPKLASNWPWTDSPRPNHFYPLQIAFYRQCCIKSTGTAWCFQFQASGRAVPFASSSTSLLQIWSSVAALSLSTARCMPRKAIAQKSRQGTATKSSSKNPASPNTCIHSILENV